MGMNRGDFLDHWMGQGVTESVWSKSPKPRPKPRLANKNAATLAARGRESPLHSQPQVQGHLLEADGTFVSAQVWGTQRLKMVGSSNAASLRMWFAVRQKIMEMFRC